MGSDWEEVQLSEIINLIGGGTPKRSIPEYWEGEIPWLSVKDFNNDYRHVSESDELITQLGLEKSSTKLLKEGQIIISARGTVGALAQVSKSMAFNQSCYGIDAKPEYTINDFLYYLMKYSISNLQRITHGAVFDTITKETFNHITIILPPLPEQKAIAHILGALDDKIELNRQMNETLESMAQALFKSWFVDFDPVIDNALAAGNPIPEVFAKRRNLSPLTSLPDGEGLGVRVNFPNAFEYTEEMGWIPEGWGVKSVDEALFVNPRITLKKGEVAPFVDMKALPTSGFSIDDFITKEYKGGTKFERGDILFSRITPCLENGKTGIVDFLNDEVGFGSTEFIILRGKENLKTSYVACLSRNSKFRAHAKLSMVGSSGRQRVQNSCFSSYYLALPNNENLLIQFNGLINPNFEKISKLNSEAKTLTKLRDTLLPKLLSGELRIPEAERLIEEAEANVSAQVNLKVDIK